MASKVKKYRVLYGYFSEYDDFVQACSLDEVKTMASDAVNDYPDGDEIILYRLVPYLSVKRPTTAIIEEINATDVSE